MVACKLSSIDRRRHSYFLSQQEATIQLDQKKGNLERYLKIGVLVYKWVI